MNGEQTRMDFGGGRTAGEVLDRIRRESRDESEKGRWFEHRVVFREQTARPAPPPASRHKGSVE